MFIYLDFFPVLITTDVLNFFLFFNFYFYFILLYNTVLVLSNIDMNPPRVYMSSQTWNSLPPHTSYHLSGSSPCTSPKHPVSCIEHRLAIRFLHDSIHVSMPFSQIIPPSPKGQIYLYYFYDHSFYFFPWLMLLCGCFFFFFFFKLFKIGKSSISPLIFIFITYYYFSKQKRDPIF